MSKFDEIYKSANPEQKLAIDAIEGPVMVIAGPGTGKTYTLALRIANILQKTQINPKNILCLTFTDTGTIAMLRKLEELIGSDAYKVKIYTFHSFCQYLIQTNLEKFPQLSGDNENLDQIGKFEIVKSILDRLPVADPLRNIRNEDEYLWPVAKMIGDLKKEGVSPDDLEKILSVEKAYVKATAEIYANFLTLRSNQIKPEHTEKLLVDLIQAGGKDSVYTRGVAEIIDEHSDDRNTLKAGIKKIHDRIFSDSYFKRLDSFAAVYWQYQETLLRQGKYDYEDMIMFVLDRLQIDEAFLADVREEFQYILVDEYQDTNSAQNQLIELIGSYFPNPNIFVVGDDDQSIFRFQGASLENILYFYKKYQDSLTSVVLKENYRSQPIVLNAAREVILRSENRLEDEIESIDKQLIAKKSSKLAKIEINTAQTETDEALMVAEKIDSLLKTGTAPGEIAVIVTKNKHMDIFAEVFGKKKIPFQSPNSLNILEDKNINNLLLLIRYLLDPMQDNLLARIMYFDYWGFSNFDILKIIRYGAYKNIPLANIIESKEFLSDAKVAEADKFVDFAEKLANWHKLVLEETASSAFPELLNSSGLMSYLLNNGQDYQSLLRFNKLYEFIKKQQRLDKEFNFGQLLGKIALAERHGLALVSESGLSGDDKVSLLTVHKSKGLEFEHVFIVNMSANNWEKTNGREQIKMPRSIVSHDYAANDEDERIRLFYVALTRAKQNLYLSHPVFDDNGKEVRKSIFLSYIGEENKVEATSEQNEAEKSKQLELLLSGGPAAKQFSQNARDYLTMTLSNYVLSPTHFNSYKQCPHCFFLNKVVKIPAAISPSGAYGNAVHTALKDYLNKLKRTEQTPTLEFLLESFKLHLNKQFLKEELFQNYLQVGENSLKHFSEHKLPDLQASSTPELNFSPFKIQVDGVPIKGIIDRIDFPVPGENIVELVDYKTGQTDPKKVSKTGKGDYYIQLLFYKLLVENYPKYNWQVKNGKIVYVEPDNSGKVQADKVFDLPESDLGWLKNELKLVYNAIMNLEFERQGDKCYTPELHDINFSF